MPIVKETFSRVSYPAFENDDCDSDADFDGDVVQAI